MGSHGSTRTTAVALEFREFRLGAAAAEFLQLGTARRSSCNLGQRQSSYNLGGGGVPASDLGRRWFRSWAEDAGDWAAVARSWAATAGSWTAAAARVRDRGRCSSFITVREGEERGRRESGG
jgi:hypothetical protein